MLRFLLIALILMFASPAHAACDDGGICQVGERSYRAKLPESWDGVSPLPVLLYFHGWGRQGLNVVRNARIAEAASDAGVLLLAPDGLGKSWDFWDGESRDVPFVGQVLADAASRWPIDRRRVIVSGFSYGAAMAWRLACAEGSAYAGFLPIAGTLWRQESLDCAGGPVRVVQVHGLKDTVMDMPTGPDADHGDAVALWRRVNGTAPAPVRRYDHARYTCRDWEGGAAPVTLCTHPGGHWIPKDWLAWALPKMLPEGARVRPGS